MPKPTSRRLFLASAVVAALVAGVGGCGVGPSSSPADAGDGLGARNSSTDVDRPRDAAQFNTATALVTGFFMAAAGGGDAAVANVKTFFTEEQKNRWKVPEPDNRESITIVRTVGSVREGAQTGNRLVVNVDYQVVGRLIGGQLTKLQDPASSPRRVTFRVQRTEQFVNQWRIDRVSGELPAGLVLSDEGLREHYRFQPIYFWDAANAVLVPDLRYIPITLSTEARATRIVTMLVEGPSAMLGAAQRLRSASEAKASVLSDSGQLVVSMAPSVIAGDDKEGAASRLLNQLRWSLRAGEASIRGGGFEPVVLLRIGNETWPKPGADPDLNKYNLATGVPGEAQVFDIQDEKVVAVLDTFGEAPSVPLLALTQNRQVVSAAINRSRTRGAFVVRGNGSRTLRMVEFGGASVSTNLRAADLGRPIWVPGDRFVLLTVGGRIRAVRDTGAVYDITPAGTGAVSNIAVSPDGRRIAYVARGRIYVAQLNVDNSSITIEPESLPIRVAAGFNPVAVTWTGVAWLKVVGLESGSPRLYDLTADGVYAAPSAVDLKVIDPIDLVAYPETDGTLAQFFVVGSQGAYRNGSAEGLNAPFYGL